jgi:hypothetical protein
VGFLFQPEKTLVERDFQKIKSPTKRIIIILKGGGKEQPLAAPSLPKL